MCVCLCDDGMYGRLTLVSRSDGSLIVFLFERFVEGDVEGLKGVLCCGSHGVCAVAVCIYECVSVRVMKKKSVCVRTV